MAKVRNTTNRITGTNRGNYDARHHRNVYVYDNTARDLDVQRRLQEAPAHKLSKTARHNRENARRMNPGYLLFLIGALTVCGLILVNYIQLQSELTAKTRQVASLESKLNSIRMENDEEYNRINSNIDLEEIKRIAIGELGMTYAGEGQIITYSHVGNDYMRKVSGDN